MTKRQTLIRVLTPLPVIGMVLSLATGWAGSASIVTSSTAKSGLATPLKDPGAVENLLAPIAQDGTPANGAPAAPGLDDAPPSTVSDAAEAPHIERVELVLGRGDTLVEAMIGEGVPVMEAHYASRALRPVLDPRRLQAGQSLALIFDQAAGRRNFLGAEIARRDGGFAVIARNGEEGFRALETDDPTSLDIAGFGPVPTDASEVAIQEAAAPIPVLEAADSVELNPIAEPPADTMAMAEPENLKIDRIDLTLDRGDTLAGLMTEAGVSATDAHYAVRALQTVENPRRLQPGQDVALVFERQGNEKAFFGLQLLRRNGHYAVVTRGGEQNFEARSVDALGALTLTGFGPAPTAGPPANPIVIEEPLPSLAVVPHSTDDVDLARGVTLIASAEDSAEEERYLDFLSLHVEHLEQTVGRGDTLAGMLSEAGVDRLDAHNAVQSLRGVFNPRRLRAGQQVTLIFENRGERRDFAGIEISPDIETRVAVSRAEDGTFSSESIANQFETRLMSGAGTIDSSLYAASNRAGVPDPVLIAVIRAYSFEVDFQRDIRPGDGFELLYEQDFDEQGELARHGNVLFANLNLRGRDHPMYRYQSEDGSVDYYDRDGQSVRRTLMRTPIDGARISSRYGMRRHPVLGYSRMHRGTDFAAPTGTPIYAAGSGTIEVRGRNGGYGRYIRIRHNGSLKTAYAHMSRYASGLSVGSRVQQGQVIGYVGTSGRSTGPHLHYEVLMENRQVNALTLDLPSGRKLEGGELVAFQRIVAMRDAQYAEAMINVQVAQSADE